MLCEEHTKEQIKAINIHETFDGNRLVCLECLQQLELSDINYVTIDEIKQDPYTLLQHLNCNIYKNYDLIRSNHLQEEVQKLRNSIVQVLDQLLAGINTQLKAYQKQSKEYLTLIFNKNLKELDRIVREIILIPNKVDALSVSEQITQVLNQYHSFELSDEYNEMNKNSVQIYETTQRATSKQLNIAIDEIKNSTEYLISFFQTTFKRYTSKREQLEAIDGQVKEIKQEQPQQYIPNDIKQCSEIKSLEEQINENFLLPAFGNLSRLLFWRIMMDQKQLKQVGKLHQYTSSQFKEYFTRLQCISVLDSVIVIISSSNIIVGCYYPAAQLKKQDVLFACNQDNFEMQSIFDQYQQHQRNLKVGRRYSSQNQFNITYCPQRLEQDYEKVTHCFFNKNQKTSKFTAQRMSIIIIQ